MPASKSKEGGGGLPLSRHANPAAALADELLGPESFTVQEEEESGPPKKSSAKCWYRNNDGPPPSSRGEIIAAFFYPVAVNIWLWFALWNNEDSTSVIDTEGTVHTITGKRLTINQVLFIIAAWFCHGNLISAHFWFTMSMVARRHKLEQAGAVAGIGYGARLFAAMQDARMPSQAERIQLAMFVFNIVAIFGLALIESWDEPWMILALAFVFPAIASPIVWYMWGSLITVARSKAIEKQRTRSVQFAATAFRGTMLALMLQIVFLARFGVFSVNMPSDPAGTLFVDILCLTSNTDSASAPGHFRLHFAIVPVSLDYLLMVDFQTMQKHTPFTCPCSTSSWLSGMWSYISPPAWCSTVHEARVASRIGFLSTWISQAPRQSCCVCSWGSSCRALCLLRSQRPTIRIPTRRVRTGTGG